MTLPTKPLPVMHEAFAQHYAAHGNASKAAKQAGYADRSSGYRLLRKANIAQRVEQLQRKALQDVGITAGRVVNELARIGFANMADYVDRRGRFSLDKLTRDQAAAVVEFKEVATGDGPDRKVVRTIKLADKQTALDKLARHLGVYEADNMQRPAAGQIDTRDLARRIHLMLRSAADHSPGHTIDGETIPATVLDLKPVDQQ